MEPLSSREKILEVAEARFAQRGYAGVGLRELASQAGLGKSSLFHHFPSKATLYLAVLDRVLLRLEERLRVAWASPGDVATRLDQSIDALVDGLAEQPTTARLLLRALFEDDALPAENTPEARSVDARIALLVGSLEGLIREGTEAGAFRAVSAAHTLQTLIGATVYYFASGAFGEGVMGEPLFSAEAVRQRKAEVKNLIRFGLHRPTQPPLEEDQR